MMYSLCAHVGRYSLHSACTVLVQCLHSACTVLAQCLTVCVSLHVMQCFYVCVRASAIVVSISHLVPHNGHTFSP